MKTISLKTFDGSDLELIDYQHDSGKLNWFLYVENVCVVNGRYDIGENLIERINYPSFQTFKSVEEFEKHFDRIKEIPKVINKYNEDNNRSRCSWENNLGENN